MSASEAFFLSPDNPVANTDQRYVEDLALRVFDRPEVREARKRALGLWLAVTDHDAPQEARDLAQQAIEEYCFNYTLKACNSDAGHPRVVRLFTQAHEWMGRKLPGARLGGDNPDNCYRLIPIEHGARYEVQGRQYPRPAANVTWTLVGNNSTSKTLATLEHRDAVVGADGRFVVTIDSEPAGGHSNHLQTVPGVKWLFVRDSMGDWAGETPNALQVRRLTLPLAPPLSEDEAARRAVEIMLEDVPITFWFTRLNFAMPPNTLTAPKSSGAVGGLMSQWSSIARIVLAEDEAFVVRANGAGAPYRHFVVNDWWYRSIDPWHRQSSLNNAQMLADADGRYTYVVSLRDPGVHNWVDPGGLRQIYAIHKWQGLPRRANTEEPQISGRLVKLDRLREILPPETRWLSADERSAQLRQREADFARRLLDR
jgi:hypothetical protein